MRWLILFFIFGLMGVVVADGVEIQVENSTTDTPSTSASSFEGSSIGYIFMALGIAVLLFMLFTLYMSRLKKKRTLQKTLLHHHSLQNSHSSLQHSHHPLQQGNISSPKTPKKDILSWFLGREKVSDKVLSHSHYAPIEQHTDQKDLQEKTSQLMSLKDDIVHEYPKVLDEDVRKVLKVTDDLLGELPDDKVDTFVHSADFETYKKVMKKVHEPLYQNKGEVEKVQKILELFDKGVIDADEARKMLGLPVRHVHIVKTEKKDKAQVLDELKRVRHEN